MQNSNFTLIHNQKIPGKPHVGQMFAKFQKSLINIQHVLIKDNLFHLVYIKYVVLCWEPHQWYNSQGARASAVERELEPRSGQNKRLLIVNNRQLRITHESRSDNNSLNSFFLFVAGLSDQVKSSKCHTVGTIPKSNIRIVERGKNRHP